MDNETIVLIDDGKTPEAKLERLFALKAIKHNPELLDNPMVFEKLCFVFNDIKPNMESFEPPCILVIAKAMQILGQIKTSWNNEITQYVAHIAQEENWVRLPDILIFAQEALEDLQSDYGILDEDQKLMQSLKHNAVKHYLENKVV